MNTEFKGYIQVYTGNGKGKTTAALGQALRAAGHGKKTYIGQFLKGQKYGELESIMKLKPWITIAQFGRDTFIHVAKGDPDTIDIQKARAGLEACTQAMLSGNYDIIVLDEINVAIHLGLVKEKSVLTFLERKPKHIEVILTGRYAPDTIIKKADLVTEMKEIKHYYSTGVRARTGIEK